MVDNSSPLIHVGLWEHLSVRWIQWTGGSLNVACAGTEAQ